MRIKQIRTSKLKKSVLLVALIVSLVFFSTKLGTITTYLRSRAFYNSPQYIVLNIGWLNNGIGYSNLPSLIKAETFDEIKTKIPYTGNEKLKLGIQYTISYLDLNDNIEDESLNKILTLSEEKNIPVLIKLDGFEWWELRPDLWNWWDPSQPGYNPDNRNNVEWTSWNSSDAIKVSWRNWGNEVRVAPQPNLASPTLLREKKRSIARLSDKIMTWYSHLPRDKKDLFVGISLDWETSIGVNFYYYNHGNDYVDSTTIPSTNSKVTLGYASVSGFNIKHSGVLTASDIDKVLNRYSREITEAAYIAGVPKEKLFLHGTGIGSYDSFITNYSTPGWSFYQHANNPCQNPDFANMLKTRNIPLWAASEWLPSGNWEASLNNTLNCGHNAFLVIYNWENIRTNSEAIQAINHLLLNSVQQQATPTSQPNQVQYQAAPAVPVPVVVSTPQEVRTPEPPTFNFFQATSNITSVVVDGIKKRVLNSLERSRNE